MIPIVRSRNAVESRGNLKASLPTPEELMERAGLDQFRRGVLLSRQRRISNLKSDLENGWDWRGRVWDQGEYRASLSLQGPSADTRCTCAPTDPNLWCAHVVALITTLAQQRALEPDLIAKLPAPTPRPTAPKPKQFAKTRQLVHAFRALGDTAIMNRSTGPARPLTVEFNLKLLSNYRKNTLALSMKIGVTRLYFVPKLAEFLSRVVDRESLPLAKKFIYDPACDFLHPADRAVIQELQTLIRRMAATDVGASYYNLPHTNRERYLTLEPLAWERLWPLLAKVSLTNDQNRAVQFAPLPLPLGIFLGRTREDAYELSVHGLSRLQLLREYCLAMADDSLYVLDPVLTEQLVQLRQLSGPDDPIRFSASTSDVEALMRHVVPSLKRLADVKLDIEIREHIIDEPLRCCIYLDAPDAGLSARLEYHYGPLVIGRIDPDRPNPPIVVRDTVREEALAGLLAQSGFSEQAGILTLHNEGQIYEFLYDVLPRLNQLAEVYVTDRVQPLTESGRSFVPKAHMELDHSLNWLEVSFEMGDLEEAEIRSVLQSLVERKRYHRLKNGTFLSLQEEVFQHFGELLGHLDLKRKDLKPSGLKLPAARGVSLMDQPEYPGSIKLGKSLRAWIDNLKNPDNMEAAIPRAMQGILREYQEYGFQWMKTLASYGLGGILADDMGLGKTIQSIAFLLSEREEKPFEAPALVVCPASLLYNWEREITRFAPSLAVAVVAGSRDEREQILALSKNYDVCITSYPLLRRDIDLYEPYEFHALLLDEAQAIKNHATQTAHSVRNLKSARRFALTGTPVENSLDDLWSIFHAIFPGLFANKEAFSQLTPDIVARRVRPFILRRLKKDVLRELPDKIETVESVDLTIEQKQIYVGYLDSLRKQTEADLDQEGFRKNRLKILAGLTRLRQICCHPGVFADNYQGGSGKLELLLEIMGQALGSDKKMLVFSQFTSMLAIIREALEERGWPYFYLDGETPTKNRLGLAESFNQGDRPIFLISLKAGGTGLNLTGADTVILYDLWWNPAVEDQAADRAHRIGQKNVVQVIRLITEGTIEEKMYQLQEKKRDLIDQVVKASNGDLGSLSEQDVRELLAL